MRYAVFEDVHPILVLVNSRVLCYSLEERGVFMKKVLVALLAVVLSFSLSGCFFALLGGVSETSKTITDASGGSLPINDESKTDAQKQTAKVGQTVTGNEWAITLTSAKVFNEVKSDFFTDKPGDGNVYLVLFFEVENVSDEDDYFNYFNIESYVDGYSSSIKILLNKPDGADTLTGNVAAGKKMKGQLSWEVPSEWEELEVSYKNSLWKGDKAATFVVTPDDIA